MRVEKFGLLQSFFFEGFLNMKLVLVGGGSHRYLSVARSVLAIPGLFENGEINLYDPAVHRAQAVGQMIQKCPEYQQVNCTVTWGTTLDQALDGADAVIVVLMAGGRRDFEFSSLTARQHGFLASDQLSPSGAILALKGGPILMDIARRMEKLCPEAWLIDFANPVAVLSAAVNNHTKIKCLGVCAGYTNHQWDLTRLLYGQDQQWNDYKVFSAGVNHLSFILPGSTHRGRDLHEIAAEKLLDENWETPQLSDRWHSGTQDNIKKSVLTLCDYYRKYRQLVFSSEGDGMVHLDIEGRYNRQAVDDLQITPEQIDARINKGAQAREQNDRDFIAWLDRDMSAADWDVERPEALYLLRSDEDLMVQVIKATTSQTELPIATSFPNRGAVRGFTDRTVLEYSQLLSCKGLRAAGTFEVPNVFKGLIGALASHQTLLGDAIATEDPRVLFEALYSYPVKQDTAESKAMWKALLEVSKDQIPAAFQQTHQLF
jgi:alpha-galactosidase/6-phospho-beta-glucosidase family protein